jgi:hypothetical protein
MKIEAKQIVALAAGAILLLGLPGQTAHAQPIMSGTATLATVGTAPTPIGTVATGTATGPEAITVTYSVALTSSVYTYEYTVNNPTGNVILPSGGNNPYFTPAFTYAPNGNAGKPAVVNSFSVSFDTTVAGAYSPENALPQNNGVNGLLWTFGALSPGSSDSNSLSR